MYRDGGKCDIDVSPNSVTRRRDAHVLVCAGVCSCSSVLCVVRIGFGGVKFDGSVGTVKDG